MEAKDQKKHRKKNSGPKAEKKKKWHLRDLQLGEEEDARKRNPKAFAVQSAVRMAQSFHSAPTNSGGGDGASKSWKEHFDTRLHSELHPAEVARGQRPSDDRVR
ncbi:hypothetical protein P7K49_023556 [Saguinus oedipus]|uniref:Uncharacterized protein n=1 Tax=Saguinus oedipus TaxID=9490 RepID=A0ABQ9UM03_SAGOE|nr:hypothetical protein P7K49_023556 [Saguinus oedipus]